MVRWSAFGQLRNDDNRGRGARKARTADQPVTGDIVLLAVPYPAGFTATAYRARFATGAIHLMPFAEGWTTRAAAAVMAD